MEDPNCATSFPCHVYRLLPFPSTEAAGLGKDRPLDTKGMVLVSDGLHHVLLAGRALVQQNAVEGPLSGEQSLKFSSCEWLCEVGTGAIRPGGVLGPE